MQLVLDLTSTQKLFDLDATGRFTDELFIISDTPYKPFSESGDSGSWIVGEDNDLDGFW